MVETDEIEEVPVHAFARVMIFTEIAGQGGAGFVENARQEDIAAQPHARAARWALVEVGCAHRMFPYSC